MSNIWSGIFSDSIIFEAEAYRIFKLQYQHNPVYNKFCTALGIKPDSIEQWQDIPLLPIEAFKEVELCTEIAVDPIKSPLVFHSSGTSSMQRSIHHIPDPAVYRSSVLNGFRRFYHNQNEPIIWAYLPHYVDNPHSSLVYMLKILIDEDASKESRFLSLNEPLDEQEIRRVKELGRPLILFGAAFGLLDLVEDEEYHLPEDTIIIETGGMKTFRREITRDEMHDHLSKGFYVSENQIHSEYGMAELVSQSYAKGGHWFETPPWMRVSVQDPDDPMHMLAPGNEGLLGIRDLGNIYSCSFILTGDKGIIDDQGRFQVLGRWNPRDLRGCNFLLEEEA